ncbi:MAG: hypothetical protein ABIF08_00515 [Nanoarchaeota archaeon]
MNKKAAFQMSLGMIVALVFAVILLTLSIAWINGVFESFTGTTLTVSEFAMQNLMNNLAKGDTVGLAVPDRTDWKRGQKGNIALGIRNDDTVSSKSYKIRIYAEAVSGGLDLDAVGPDGVTKLRDIVENALSYGKYEIRAPSESKTSLVDVTIPTIASGYSFTFRAIVFIGTTPDSVLDLSLATVMSTPAYIDKIYGTDQFIIDIVG